MMTSSHTTPRYIISVSNRRGGSSAHLSIVNVVNLVKNYEFHVPDKISAFVEHAPQNLSRHNETAGLWINLDIPR